EDRLAVAVVVLHGGFYNHVLLARFEVYRFGMQNILVLVEVLDKGGYPPFVSERGLSIRAQVIELDLQTLVQKGELAQPGGNSLKTEIQRLEDPVVRHEGDLRTPAVRLSCLADFRYRFPSLVALFVDSAPAPALQVKSPAESIHHRAPDAVHAARALVAIVARL